MKEQKDVSGDVNSVILFVLVTVVVGVVSGFAFKTYSLNNNWLFIPAGLLLVAFFIDELATYAMIGAVCFFLPFYFANLGIMETINSVGLLLTRMK